MWKNYTSIYKQIGREGGNTNQETSKWWKIQEVWGKLRNLYSKKGVLPQIYQFLFTAPDIEWEKKLLNKIQHLLNIFRVIIQKSLSQKNRTRRQGIQTLWMIRLGRRKKDR